VEPELARVILADLELGRHRFSLALERISETKSDAGRRTIPLPRFAIDALQARLGLPYVGEQTVIFTSTAASLRDPDNFGKQWRTVRDELGVPGVTTHSFRKTVATLIDDEGLSARIGADHLGHAQVFMTQDRYMARGQVHTEVAELLDRAVANVWRDAPTFSATCEIDGPSPITAITA
jgi:integrase